MNRLVLALALCAAAVPLSVGPARGANDATAAATATFRQYCFQCHGDKTTMAGMNLESLTANGSVGESFQQWNKVADVLHEKRMPPKGMPQPGDEARAQAASWIHDEVKNYIARHDGDPGRVTVRRLTSGEYAYTIRDLTGLDLNVGIDSTSDSVGGEGFTNFGDVQFMQDANLERYLDAAKKVANHAVIGSGPLEFFADPGKTGFELSAIARIREIYAANGFRTVSGEGGRPFGLERYGKALYVAWRFKHRAALGESKVTIKDLARREGLTTRFSEHIWSVVNNPSLGYPSSEIAARWRNLPSPGTDVAQVRVRCEEIQKFLVTWPSWLFNRGDLAAGGAGDESPLEFSDRTLKASPQHRFLFVRGGRGAGGRTGPPPGPAKIYINQSPIDPGTSVTPLIVWRNPAVGIRKFTPREAAPPVVSTGQAERRGMGLGAPRVPLRTLVSAETAAKLNFGKGPEGVTVGPDDFVTEGPISFEVPLPDGPVGMDFEANAEIAGDLNQVVRITISDREDGGAARGRPTWALVGDMQKPGYKAFRAGVMEFANVLPPNSHGEPTPADKDPVPEPFDNTYNVPEHDEFVVKVKYIRDDRFVRENMLDPAARVRLDHAWNDLYASFEYHDNYLRLLAKKFNNDLAAIEKYAAPLRSEHEAVMRAQVAAQPAHVEDCLKFASRAWRRPLAEREKQSLRTFYDTTLAVEKDHRKAVRAVLTRTLVAPAFLYRLETLPVAGPLSSWAMASRLSYFLWSSIPDDELRRAASAGDLTNPKQLGVQVKRMLADQKARRLSTEFFGQWLGFYHFDQHRGVDTTRFPEFSDDVKSAMYDEAVSFFEHVIRKDRPIRDILFADYTFLNKALAKHYSVAKEIKATDGVEIVEGANDFRRGGLLRLGAVLTATSAPLRTSPVKRGDWVLRRILGTAVPPPPADAGSIPADEKAFGGMSVRERLEVHKRNATCAGCHVRIDPLGFPLERYDSVGRWREKYSDGKPIDDTTVMADKTPVAGIDGLLDYLRTNESQVRRTLANKLVGYALGRTIQAGDQPLIDRMVASGGDATFARLATEIVTSKQFRNRGESEQR